MTGIALVTVLAITVEALVEYAKTLAEGCRSGGWKTLGIQLAALALSVTLCLLARADLFGTLGVQLGGEAVGCVCTGLLAARGSNYIADFLRRVQGRSHG